MWSKEKTKNYMRDRYRNLSSEKKQKISLYQKNYRKTFTKEKLARLSASVRKCIANMSPIRRKAYKASQRISISKWRLRNKKKLYLYEKKWRENNRERVNAYAREYKRKHRDKINIRRKELRLLKKEISQKGNK